MDQSFTGLKAPCKLLLGNTCRSVKQLGCEQKPRKVHLLLSAGRKAMLCHSPVTRSAAPPVAKDDRIGRVRRTTELKKKWRFFRICVPFWT